MLFEHQVDHVFLLLLLCSHVLHLLSEALDGSRRPHGVIVGTFALQVLVWVQRFIFRSYALVLRKHVLVRFSWRLDMEEIARVLEIVLTRERRLAKIQLLLALLILNIDDS